ncbi:unnamed protein product, partial [Ixodes hexagonus]
KALETRAWSRWGRCNGDFVSMKAFCWKPQVARKKVLFSGEVLQSTAEMSSQARIRKKKTLEKISLPNYSQQDTKTFRTSMHMEVVEDEEEDSRDKEPSENASTIVIETTVKSPEVKAGVEAPPQEPDYGE